MPSSQTEEAGSVQPRSGFHTSAVALPDYTDCLEQLLVGAELLINSGVGADVLGRVLCAAYGEAAGFDARTDAAYDLVLTAADRVVGVAWANRHLVDQHSRQDHYLRTAEAELRRVRRSYRRLPSSAAQSAVARALTELAGEPHRRELAPGPTGRLSVPQWLVTPILRQRVNWRAANAHEAEPLIGGGCVVETLTPLNRAGQEYEHPAIAFVDTRLDSPETSDTLQAAARWLEAQPVNGRRGSVRDNRTLVRRIAVRALHLAARDEAFADQALDPGSYKPVLWWVLRSVDERWAAYPPLAELPSQQWLAAQAARPDASDHQKRPAARYADLHRSVLPKAHQEIRTALKRSR